MKPRAKPGFWLVATREWRWLFRDRVALFLIFGVPLFTFVVLTAAFSQPVIRGLGVVVVDADRSDTSRALIEQVAASPNLSIAARTGDLASAASAIRSGDAIAAPAELGPRRRPPGVTLGQRVGLAFDQSFEQVREVPTVAHVQTLLLARSGLIGHRGGPSWRRSSEASTGSAWPTAFHIDSIHHVAPASAQAAADPPPADRPHVSLLTVGAGAG